MSNTVTRSVLAEAIYRDIGISYNESLNLVDIVFEEIMNGVVKDGVTKIPAFGSFYAKDKSERIGRNPKSKKEVMISARKVISFYASNLLKNKINA